MKNVLFAALAAAALVSSAAGANELRSRALDEFQALPAEAPPPRGNPLTTEKIELGKALFYEPRLSASGVFSCASCHNLSTGGDDNMEVSVGHGWQKGPRNSPTVFNSVLNEAQFWDGRAEDLAEQAKGPVVASVEMANTPENAVATLKSMPAYTDMFKSAFPNEADPVNFDNLAQAIEAFEATLLTPAPFDRWLEGDDKALGTEALAGLEIFMDRGCSSCHSGVNVGGHGYYPFGLVEKPGADILPPNDKGRFSVTATVDDEYVFRASPLRNVALTAPYFHSGKVWDLGVAVEVMAESQLGVPLEPEETRKVVAFLESLTGTAPEIILPVLPAETATTPRLSTIVH